MELFWKKQLYKEYETICYQHNLTIYTPVIDIRSLKNSWGYWDSLNRTIVLSSVLIEKYSWDIVIEILKHEIAHQLVSEYFEVDSLDKPHGEYFQKACTLLGMNNWAKRSVCDLEQFPNLGKEHFEKSNLPVIKKIRKLLALSKSGNENEAFLAMTKARELSEKHNIEVLESSEEDDFDYISIGHNKKVTHSHEVQIASLLTSFFKVEIIFSDTFCQKTGEEYKCLLVYGTKSNIEIAEYIYYFIWNKLPEFFYNFKKTTNGTVNKKSYYSGILTSIRKKLANSYKKENKNLDENKNLSLQKHNQLLNSFLRNRHPKISTRSIGGGHLNRNSFEQGIQDGKNFQLNKGVSKNSTLRKLLHSGEKI